MVTATLLDTRLRAMSSSLIGRMGRTLTLRKATKVTGSGSALGSVASSPLSSKSLAAPSGASMGAGVIALQAAGLTGLLVAGDKLLIAGIAQLFTVTGGPYQPDGTGLLASVSITPALPSNVSASTAVAVTFSGTDYTLKGAVSTFSLSLVGTPSGDGQIEAGDAQIVIAQQDLDALGIVVTTKDEIYYGPDPSTAKRAAVIAVSSLPSGELDAAVQVHARVAS